MRKRWDTLWNIGPTIRKYHQQRLSNQRPNKSEVEKRNKRKETTKGRLYCTWERRENT
jgi:hypothetical protein